MSIRKGQKKANNGPDTRTCYKCGERGYLAKGCLSETDKRVYERQQKIAQLIIVKLKKYSDLEEEYDSS